MTYYALTLSVPLANDMIRKSENVLVTGYDTLQTQYELTRGITAVLIPPLLGILMNFSSKLWNYTRYKDNHADLQYSLLVFTLQNVWFFIVAGSLYISNVWLFLMTPPIVSSFMNCVFFTNINFCYPVQVRAMFMAFSNLLSLSILWTQTFVIDGVQLRSDLGPYFYSQLALGIFAVILTPVIFMRVLGREPGLLQRLDQDRVNAIRPDKKQLARRRVSVAVPVDYERVTTADGYLNRIQETAEVREMIKLSLIGAPLRESVFFPKSRRSTVITLSNFGQEYNNYQ